MQQVSKVRLVLLALLELTVLMERRVLLMGQLL
jgi:hypothetical protein